MTKSKFNILTWVTLIQLPLYLGLVIYLMADTVINNTYETRNQEMYLLIFFLLIIGLLIFSSIVFFKKIHKVEIDSEKQIISFRNILNRNFKKYSFKELAGYYSSVRNVGSYGTRTKILLIVMDNKLVDKISSMFYSNFSDLETSMKGLTFLGQLDYSDIKSIKINFGGKIID
jgi:cell division protein FtsL